jgi:N-acetylmuramoyl-L-alanine amidase
MTAVFIYLLKVVCCSALFAGYYFLFLRNRRLHVFNRFYILMSFIASLLLPALSIEWTLADARRSETAYRIMHVISSKEREVVMPESEAPVITATSFISAMYLLVSLAILVVTTVRLIALYKIKRESEVVQKDEYSLVLTNHEKAPFSFFRFLFWRKGIDTASPEGKKILRHELAHIHQRHTYDKIFVQLVLAFIWINPLFWLFCKELSLVHEFLADEAAIEDRDTESFARMLLQEYCRNNYPGIVHPFFYSSVKRRLFMLEKKHKPKFAHLRRLLVLPLLGMATVLFSFTISDTPAEKAKQSFTIAIDAGHGGGDNGAIGINGVKEKDLALKITKKLTSLAATYNVKVVNLRPDDRYVKLEQRSAQANEVAADMLVSIHVNKRADDDQDVFSGFDIMIGKSVANYNDSRSLGSAIASKLENIKINTRMMDKSLHILRSANMPAVLIECGYIDNTADVARINDEKELDRLCGAIISGAVAYHNSTK